MNALTSAGVLPACIEDSDVAVAGFAGYRLVLVPYHPNLSAGLIRHLSAHASAGGRVVGFYTLPATYLDDKGNRVEMDGSHGDGAGIAGKNSKPQWFALRGKGWAHSCVAVTPFDNISFWDGGAPSYGQLGFSSGRIDGMRFAYFVCGEQSDFGFAERDYQRILPERKK